MSATAIARPFAPRALLRRLTTEAATAGAAILAALTACGLIATAALTLNQSDDRAKEIREIRAVLSSGRDTGHGPDAVTRFADALEIACAGVDAESAHR